MTTENTNAGGAGGASNDGGAGGAGGAGAGGDAGAGGGQATVARADHERALQDLHRFKEQAKDLAGKTATLQRQLDELKEQGLHSTNDWKKLYDLEKQKREAAETERNGLKQTVLFGERYRAAIPKLKEAGLRDDALNLLERESFEEIQLEATSAGRFIVNGVDDYVAAFKQKYPYAFQAPRVPNVNGGGGREAPAQGKWTPDRLFAMEQECKRKGDMAPYYAAVGEYQAQRTKR